MDPYMVKHMPALMAGHPFTPTPDAIGKRSPEELWEFFNREGHLREAAQVPILWRCVHPNGILPTHSQEGDAGVDLFTPEDVTVPAHGKVLIKIGFEPAIPAGYAGFIWSRSGLSLKASLEKGAGLIDRTFRKELGVILYNYSDYDHHFEAGKAVAQLVIMPYVRQDSIMVDELPPSERTEGWGSSGR